MKAYLKHIYSRKQIRSQRRNRSFVYWEDCQNEMFKVKETSMTQYISDMSDYILEKKIKKL